MGVMACGQATLMLPHLPQGTNTCHIMQSFSDNLLSMGQFCDADCTVVFTKTDAQVCNNMGTVILQEFCEPAGSCMWRFNLQPPQHTASSNQPLACNETQPAYNIPNIIPCGNDDNENPTTPAIIHGFCCPKKQMDKTITLLH